MIKMLSEDDADDNEEEEEDENMVKGFHFIQSII